jgi:PleD family two-component response regulator
MPNESPFNGRHFHYDEQTGLFTAEQFPNIYRKVFSGAFRNAHTLSLAFLQINKLSKKIPEIGAQKVDEIYLTVASVIGDRKRPILRDSDWTTYYYPAPSDYSFAIIFEEQDGTRAYSSCSRITERIEELSEKNSILRDIRLCGGIATYEPRPVLEEIEQLKKIRDVTARDYIRLLTREREKLLASTEKLYESARDRGIILCPSMKEENRFYSR